MSTDSVVGGRVLHLKLFGFFRYGSDDKTHSAAFVLSLLLLAVIFIIVVLGLWATNKELVDKVLASLTAAFTFTGGVAIGRGGSNQKGND
jgi:ABC-type Fe3+ transport system permease subunit